MGVAAPRAPFGGRGPGDPFKSSVTGPSLLVNCYLETKFHKKIRVNPPPPPPPLKHLMNFRQLNTIQLLIFQMLIGDWTSS